MPDFLAATVRERTKLDGRYRESAAWQSMEQHLNDWRTAHARLDHQIAELTVMMERRQQQVRRGGWPASFDECRQRGRHRTFGGVPGAGVDVMAQYSPYCIDCGRLPDVADFDSRCGECGGTLVDHRCSDCGTRHNGSEATS